MMRKAILVLVMTVVFGSAAFANLTDGFVAYYPFNGNANDESGYGHHGTVNGATPTTERFGNPNSAYSFDGVDDYVRVPDAPALDGMNALSLAVWVRVSGTGQETEVLNKYLHDSGNNLDDSYSIGIDSSPQAVFQYSTEDAYVINISSDTLMSDSRHHIVGVYTGAEGSIYIDGSNVSLWRDDPDPRWTAE